MPADDLIKVTIRGRGFKYGSDIPIQQPWIFTPQYDGALVDGSADDGRGIIFDASPLKIVPDSTGYIEFDVPSVADSSGNPTGYTIKVQDPTRKKPYNISPDHTLITPDPTTGKYYYDLKDVVPPGVPLAGDSVLVQTGITQAFADGRYLTTAAISGKADTTALTAETNSRTSADATLTSSLAAKAAAADLTTETTNRTTADGLKIDKAHLPAIAADAASVDNTGATDTGTALQAFLDGLAGTEQVARLYGTFKHSATIVFKGHVDASGATFNYTGSGLAVQVGAGGSAVRLDRAKVHLPKVINTTKPGTGWTASTIGVKCINLNACWVWAPHIQGFETGFLEYGQDAGVSYNHFFLGHLDNNKVNQKLDGTSTGWVNQNNYYGGRFGHNSGEGTNVSGTKHILLTSNMSSTENNNTWYGPSLESPNVVEFVIDAQASNGNVWDQARFEYTTGSPNVRWGARATGNQLRRGNNLANIVETFVSGAAHNDIETDTWSRHTVSGTKGFVMENDASSASQTIAGLRAGGTILGDDPVTAYAWRGTAAGWGFKRFGDAFDRVQIDATNGQILTGNGTGAPTTVLGPSTSSTVNTYTAAGSSTWTKPAGCNAVMVLCIGGGAGGGSGRRGAAGTVRCGGGGGGGGHYVYRVFPASVLGSTATVTVGAGGAGGAAVTADDTNGNNGVLGGASFFTSTAVSQGANASPGVGGTNALGTGGAGSPVEGGLGGTGGAASTTGLVGVAGVFATTTVGGSGGGSGGGITSADAVSNGGAGGLRTGTSGGAAGVSPGGAGGAGTSNAVDQPGVGGGGGASSITGVAGTGGAGASVGGGGGGGGASLNGNNSGAGGAGSAGFVMVIAV